jgi:hypothetical protein
MTSQSRRRYSFSTGRVAEVRFERAAKHLGFKVSKSSRKDDMYWHIDYWMEMNDGKWGVDVKGNNLPDQIWCEFKNVSGNPGWMYGGAAIIAFDMPEEGGFSVVDREDLRLYCEENVEDEQVTNRKDAYKKKYTRKDREDVITIIKSLSSYRVWKYSIYY